MSISLWDLEFNHRFASLGKQYSASLSPTPLDAVHLVSISEDAAALVGLDLSSEDERVALAAWMNGDKAHEGAQPLAMLYAGHQFGQFVPQLGDGRAILLGDVKNADGSQWELQVKGCGPTPFSRNGDGRAVLRSSIREYLCSEAMAGLGIPTTRAMALMTSETQVYREMPEKAASVLRMAPSFLRFGHFEVFYYRQQFDELKALIDFSIEHYFPQLCKLPEQQRYAKWQQTITFDTAKMFAQWQLVGFNHGVMNSDNMSILGLTIDYGPFAFLDGYNPEFICNHSDHQGRYSFKNQPQMGLFNSSCLAQTLVPFLDVEMCKAPLEDYSSHYAEHYMQGLREKFGLLSLRADDEALFNELLQLMQAEQTDYTRLFRALSYFSVGAKNEAIRDMFLDRDAFDAWAEKYAQRLMSENNEDDARKERMLAVNPKYILRNYLAQNAIDAAEQQNDFSLVNDLLHVLKHPYDEHPEFESFADEPPDWAKSLVLSCSS